MAGVLILEQTFNPWTALAEHEAGLVRARCGAVASFVGSMRDFNQGDPVSDMFLEHYPGMTERYLRELNATAAERWAIEDSLIIHRVGKLRPGDYIVLVAAWAAHRQPAFEACHYLVEALKARAPFWKRESLAAGGERWVGGHE